MTTRLLPVGIWRVAVVYQHVNAWLKQIFHSEEKVDTLGLVAVVDVVVAVEVVVELEISGEPTIDSIRDTSVQRDDGS